MNNNNPLTHSCEQCCCCDNCPFLRHTHESSERRLGKQEEFTGSGKNNHSTESKMGAAEGFKGKRSHKRD